MFGDQDLSCLCFPFIFAPFNDIKIPLYIMLNMNELFLYFFGNGVIILNMAIDTRFTEIEIMYDYIEWNFEYLHLHYFLMLLGLVRMKYNFV